MTQTQQDKIDEAKERLKNFPAKILIVGVDNDFNFTCTVVINKKDYWAAIENYMVYRTFTLKEIDNPIQ